MSFMGHIKELVNRLRTIVIAVVISTIIVMIVPVSLDFSNVSAVNPYYPTITSTVITNLQERFLPEGAELLPLSFLSPLEVYVFVALILGVMISTPVIAYELYKFINPALYKHERKAILQFITSFVGLFAFGIILGYLYIIPVSMRTISMFSDMLSLPPTYAFSEFYSLVGFALLTCGLILTLPAFLVILVKAGILKTKTLTGNRKFLYGFLIIAIALIDPDPGLVTEALIFLPLVILTEISILIAKRIEKNREESEDSSDT
ncbi:MAG: twin-arginine translocase subunit TatC [Candidatus Bathyarchaeum sp.]|nr:MAG: twin-arginine translocase subunit TatC [Candidatus Bathyarchaeum sp.]